MAQTAQPKLKAYVSQFTIRLGPMTTVGRMIGVRKSKTNKASAGTANFVMCTPGGEPVTQRYVDPYGTVFYPNELAKGKVLDDGTITVVPKQAVESAKASDLPKNVLNLTVHPAEQVDNCIYPTDANGYILDVDSTDPVNIQWHDLISAVIDEGKYALVGYCNFSNHEGFFRLSKWRGHIVLEKMLYPEDLEDHSVAPAPEVDEIVMIKANSMLAKLSTDFDPEKYTDNIKAKVLEVEKAFVASGGTFVPATKKPDTSGFSLLDALDSFDA